MSGYGVVARAVRRGVPEQRWRDANPSLLAHRLWLGADHKDTSRHLEHIRSAVEQVPAKLLTDLDTRRRAAATLLPRPFRRLLIVPQWRLVVGHGESGVLESGLTLSTVYGVPMIPGSALKGVCARQARRDDLPADDRERWFGGQGQGGVQFWDALPIGRSRLVVDVLTPHVKPYYDAANSGGAITEPPAEYHNPVPVRFLAVEDTTFAAYVSGPPADLDAVAGLLVTACDEWGLGAKTSAGYGYCSVSEET